MLVSKSVQAFTRFALYGLAILIVPGFIVRYFVLGNGTRVISSVLPSPSVPMDPAFSAKLEAGKKLFRDGLYSDALTAYQETEKSVARLNESEYQALMEARLQVAHAYESAGDTDPASKAYVVVVSCALRESKAFAEARNWDQSLARAQDGEKFAHQVTDKQLIVMERAMNDVVTAYEGAMNTSKALQEQQRLLDYLETSGDRSESLARAYANLGNLYGSSSQWEEAERALNRAAEICDLDENRRQSAAADYDRNYVDYQLVSLYLNAGKTDVGLAKAEEFFEKYRGSDFSSDYKYRPRDFALLGVALARQARQQDSIEKWDQRTREAS